MTLAMMQTQVAVPDVDIRALAPGTQLLGDQYTIESYLSSGGFGITYLARDSLNRQVVIKECFPEALCSRTDRTVRARSSSCTNEFNALVDMFVREARSLSKLGHPNIVGVHQIFEDNDTAYMALDFINGHDLLHQMETGEAILSPDRVVALTRTLLDAIAAVHAADMLHRDISPDNILIDQTGKPCLIDFGAAREEATKKSRAISALLVVKDGYSPQEFYISGGAQGPSSDLYSLAATVYHLITGAPPPNSQSRLAALAANRPDPYEPLLGQRADYAPGFLQAIDAAMQVFPTDRPQTAQEWLAIIDGTGRGAAAQTSEVQKVISHLVDEVAKYIEEDAAEEAKRAEEAPTKVVIAMSKKEADRERWWPLTEPYEPPAKPLFSKRDKPATGTQAPMPSFGPSPFQKVRLRLGAVVLTAVLGFSVHQNPTGNLATQSLTELRQIIESAMR